MNILVVGYGSMGKRRIRLLKKLCADVSFVCVDSNSERLSQIENDGYIGYSNLEEALKMQFDVAFICTSPGHHADLLLQIISAGINVFTELNLVSDKYDEIVSKAKEKNVKVFMSSTMLYDAQIVSIMKYVGKSPSNMAYVYHVGQYLPDWHPWDDYRHFFIGKKETNGCREILAIQLPWIIDLFGNVSSVSVIKKRNTKLDIDFDDTYIITIEHENGNTGVFICDVLARKAVSYLEIMGEDRHLFWNGTPESLKVFDVESNQMKRLETYEETEHIDGYAEIVSENQYIDEIKAFLAYVYEDVEPRYTIEKDKEIISIIDRIEA